VLLLLIRHASTDLTRKQLVGRTPGVHLNAAGIKEAEALMSRLEGVPIDVICSSPLERALETAKPLAAARGLTNQVEPGWSEVDYGTWTGQEFKTLRRTDLWKRVQQRPADARFPGGEAIREVQARVVDCIEALAVAHPQDTVAAVSHGDVIKTALAHLAGLHLDLFQRIHVSPASISVVLVGAGPPALLAVNDVGGLRHLIPRRRGRTRQN
jgi:probable phosphoglycerate mutase